jgi:hydrogenase maturation protease
VGITAAIIGIGNILLRDEGLGVHALRALEEGFLFPPGVELIDGGTMGLDLLPYLEGKDALLIMDAVDMGAIKAFLDTKFSVHQIGVPDMLFAASLKGILPPRLCLAGMQPGVVETGLEMSDPVRAALPALLEAARGKLISWGMEVTKRADVPCDTI